MVRIVQCLCPARHCIMGIAYEPGTAAGGSGMDDIALDESNASAFLRSIVEQAIANKTINPWCHICHSKERLYEDAVSKFKTIEEAQPELERLERANLRSRGLIDSLKLRASRN
jgi:hypothetical protein